MKACLLIAAMIAIAGCASTGTQDVASDNGTVCTRETPVGSNLPVTKCRSAQQAAQEKADAERAQAEIQRSSTFRPPTQ